MIVKIKRRENPFAQIDNGILQDKRLSYKARGIAAYLFSHSDGWQVSIKDLVDGSDKDGRESIQNGMKELKAFGYAELKTDRDKAGKITGKHWQINEEITVERVSPLTVETVGLETRSITNKDINIFIVELVEYLNNKANRSFSAKTKATRQHLSARLDEGYTPEQIKAVIDDRVQRWANDPHMAEYLRPNTLFAGKFESYLQAAQSAPQHANTDEALNDCTLSEEEEQAYQRYIKFTLNNYLNLFKSQCRVFSKSEYLDYLTNKSMPALPTILTTREKRKMQLSLHEKLNSEKWFRDKYPTVWEAYRAAVKAISNHEKPLV